MAADRSDSCKGCTADVNVTRQQIERVLATLESNGVLCVSEELYRQRLRECEQCPSLLYGTTCQYCGCIVQVRAKLAEKHCPKPGHASW